MSNNTAPDSWESQADSTSTNNSPQHTAEDVTTHFSTLNVNAVEFVPSFSFAKPEPEVVDKPSPTSSQESNSSPQHNPLLNGKLSIFNIQIGYTSPLCRYSYLGP